MIMIIDAFAQNCAIALKYNELQIPIYERISKYKQKLLLIFPYRSEGGNPSISTVRYLFLSINPVHCDDDAFVLSVYSVAEKSAVFGVKKIYAHLTGSDIQGKIQAVSNIIFSTRKGGKYGK